MPQRATAHAARRRWLGLTLPEVVALEDGRNGSMVSREWDATTYDDVIPHRLRGTLVLDDDGEPAGLTDLVADRILA